MQFHCLRLRFFWISCARRLAEDPNVNVLLLEAGGNDDVPGVMDAVSWPTNLGSEGLVI